MLILAAILFAVAALGGLIMAYIHFAKDRNPPAIVAILHGVLGATALVILGWSVVQMGAPSSIRWALGLFAVAALGGFFLVSYHARGLRLPSVGIVVHAAVAVVGFLLLLYGIFSLTEVM